MITQLSFRAMSEAQYVCTGQFGESSLSHYGLGLQKYCHFTSPIRRYADVVVHKQLLAAAAAAAVTTKESISFPRRVERKGLEVLPASSAISILHGEGLVEEPKRGIVTDDEESEALFTPIQHSKNTSLSRSQLQAHSHSTEKITLAKYKASEVTSICKGLNQQNRRAKVRCEFPSFLFISRRRYLTVRA